MGEFRVHHIRFFDYQPKAIHCMCYEKHYQKLALSRSDGSIEIYSVKDKWFQEKVIPGSSNKSVEAICWQGQRLFTAGLDGNVTEYDLLRLCPKSFASSNAGPVWCLTTDSANKYLAAGTEDGCVVLFETDYNIVQYLKSFDKQEGRILCISWHAGDNIIVTGGADNIRLWSVNSGHAIRRLTLGRQENNKETIVWCLAITSDMTIISGDSRGKTSFWNGKHGTLIKSFQSHKADILCLCVNEAENSVVSSGIDCCIVKFQYVAPKPESDWKMWVKVFTKSQHVHDVRAVAMVGEQIVSGGVDTNLIVAEISAGQKFGKQLKFRCSPHKSLVHLSKGAHLIMLQYSDYLEVWRLGHTYNTSDKDREILALRSNPIKLLQLKTKNNSTIVCCAISYNATWLSYSDLDSMKIYQLYIEDKDLLSPKVSLSKARVISPVAPVHHMVFTKDEKYLITTTCMARIQILSLRNGEAAIHHTFPALSESPDHIHLMCVSDDGNFVAVADNGCNIAVYSLLEKQLLFNLPRYSFQATAMSFTPRSQELVMAYADKKIYEFDIRNAEYSDWCKSHCNKFPRQWLNQYNMVRNITFDPRDSNKIILSDEYKLTILDKSQPFPETLFFLGRHGTKPGHSGDISHAFHICFRYKYCLHLDTLDSDWLVVVEKTPTAIAESLPPALVQKKFGT